MQIVLQRHRTTEENTRRGGCTRNDPHHCFEPCEVEPGGMDFHMFVATVAGADNAAVRTQKPKCREMSGREQDEETRLMDCGVFGHIDGAPAVHVLRLRIGKHVFVGVCSYAV